MSVVGRKKLLNAVESCVDEMLLGLFAAHPGLSLDAEGRVLSVRERYHGNVALVSGGGSGHEPFAAGYVGHGMLTAAVAGSVFASPPSGSILAAINSVTQGSDSGALVIIPNYTGDCLNFGLAVEKSRNNGVNAEAVVVGEDCALDVLDGSTGRRGMCGLLFVFKICGSMSAKGRHLKELASTAREIVLSMATIGVGLSACSLPGSTTPLFRLPDDEIELGLGVHGEAGLQRIKMCSTAETVSIMLARLFVRLKLQSGDQVAVLINNLGSSSQLEQWVFASETYKQLTEQGTTVCRMYVGHLMTSLDMAGFQISLLKLPESKRSDWLSCLDAETDAPGWPGGNYSFAPRISEPTTKASVAVQATETLSRVTLPSAEESCSLTEKCLLAAARAICANEKKLNELDSGCGDGDCGTTLCRLAKGVVMSLPGLANNKPGDLLTQLALMSETCMGGTSGAIYSLMFTTAGAYLSLGGSDEDWAVAWKKGLEGVMKYSRARLGDRTMLDALIPACKEFEKHPRSSHGELVQALCRAALAAKLGCDETRLMKANAGRASYVGSAHITDVDAGAYAVTMWLDAICRQLEQDIK